MSLWNKLGAELRTAGKAAQGAIDEGKLRLEIFRVRQHADKAAVYHRARRDGAGVGDDHVAGVAVARKRVRYEAVIAGIAHRRVKKPVNEQRAGLLVELVLDRLAADGNLDDDVDVVGRVVADLDGL